MATEKQLGITKPAIPAEIETQDYQVKVETYIDGLDTPWGIAFPDQETILITERPGRLRVVNNGVLNPEPVTGTPEVVAKGQGGLLDVAVDPDYQNNGWVYLSFSHGISLQTQEDTLAMTSIVRGKIKDNSWQEQQVIYQAADQDYLEASIHFGGRLAFDNQGYLYFTVGDRSKSDLAQDLTKPNGKVHRIHPDGSVPKNNPYYGQTRTLNTVYSYGHRNPQGLTTHPVTGAIWEAEHGPLGGDELNLIKESANYGWPVITHGINYDGEIISEIVRKEGMEQPALYWKPSIAVCGIDFYSGDLFPKWNNLLLVSALRFEEVRLLDIEGDRVIYQQTLLKIAGRVRQTSPGPD
jgi:glucose/arabinose dehydrogenase